MNRQKQHSCFTAGYACIQSSYWLSFSAVMGFTSLYLLDAGFTNTEIGIIIAIAGLISAVLQPLFAGYADKPPSLGVSTIIFWSLFRFGTATASINAGFFRFSKT